MTPTIEYIWPVEAQVNTAGEVAVKVHPHQHLIAQKTPSGKEYVFAIRANIALSWVDPRDVQHLLDRHIPCGCGNGSGRKYSFIYANESDVRRWTNGGGS